MNTITILTGEKEILQNELVRYMETYSGVQEMLYEVADIFNEI